ncbi:hypothetical protein TSYNT_7179 [Tepidanaerobacter syntrophicus]|uniref:Uncharacterized protein n=1 Tax=Tepidanaerobacter syntrophicus TaxID=224999 RepID=A0A0U9HEB4_9FIRM|nr:hypothetical protein TSYNT_7179 [Tepidanaerobacter syntrophicus]
MLFRYLFEDKVVKEKIAKAKKDINKMLKEFYED